MAAEVSASTLRVTRVPELERIPGLVHGFEQRLLPSGGESPDETRTRVRRALEPQGRLLLLKQVHGATVRVAPWQGRPEGDAAMAEAPGLLLGIESADCLPVLLVDPLRRAAAVAALVRGGSRAADLVAALGPANEACCYEVGEELRAAFGDEWQAVARTGPRGRPHLDLRAANARQLERAGLRPERIHHVSHCTSCLSDLYHSYRREGWSGGRMISFVGWSL